MAENPISQQPQRKNPNLLACIACRRAHMKCNGTGTGSCPRCTERGTNCVWVESRRGYKPSKREPSSVPSEDSEATSSSNPTFQPRPNGSRNQKLQPPSVQLEMNVQAGSDNMLPLQGEFFDSYGYDGYFLPTPDPSIQSGLQLHETRASNSDGNDVLLDLFYKFFFPSHPFVLPQRMRSRSPEFLKAVLRFGGSHFVSHGGRDALKGAAISQITLSAPDNGFKVQALALLAMISFSRNEQEEGQAYLTQAIDLALWLGLNKADFAVRFGNNDPTMEESWRRTWWDLFIVEGLISCFTGKLDSSRLRSIITDVPLPGHCEAYDACSPSTQLRSFEEMQERAFSDEEYHWPSFAYKIEAMYIMQVRRTPSATLRTTHWS